MCDIARILYIKIKKIAKIMGKFSENQLAFFTKKENKENQTDFWALLYTSEKKNIKKIPLNIERMD